VPIPTPLVAAAAFSSLLLLASGGACAADNNWSGPYVGVEGGYGAQSIKVPGISGLNPSGPIGDIQGGYNQQFGRIVIGAEVDVLPLPGLFGHASNPCPVSLCGGEPFKLNTKVHTVWAVGGEGRLGVALDSWMPYVTAGYHYEDVRVENEIITPVGNVNMTKTTSGQDWYAGAGLSYRINQHLSADAKWIYVPSEIQAFHASTSANLGLAGVNWKF
jgi:outer membrane immunogenic protein